jgi:hypothetical protein
MLTQDEKTKVSPHVVGAIETLQRCAAPHIAAIEEGRVAIQAKAMTVTGEMGLAYLANIFTQYSGGNIMLSVSIGTEYALAGIPLTGLGFVRMPAQQTVEDSAHEVLRSIFKNSDFDTFLSGVVSAIAPRWATAFHYESAIEQLKKEAFQLPCIYADEMQLTPVSGSAGSPARDLENEHVKGLVRSAVARKIGQYMLEKGLFTEEIVTGFERGRSELRLKATVVVPLKE